MKHLQQSACCEVKYLFSMRDIFIIPYKNIILRYSNILLVYEIFPLCISLKKNISDFFPFKFALSYQKEAINKLLFTDIVRSRD